MFRGWYNISLTVVGGLARLTVVDSASRVVQYIPDFFSRLVRLTVIDSASRVVQYIPDCILYRRFGAVDGGRFCFEGGTRCGKGEGLHVFRVDNPEELQVN